MNTFKTTLFFLFTTLLSLISQPIQWERVPLSVPNNNLQPSTIAVADSNKIFVGSYMNGIFRSLDGGKSWEKINEEIESVGDIKVNPVNKDVYFYINNHEGLYHCDDAGQIVSQIFIEGKYGSEVVLSMEISPEGILYLASYTGIHKSTDGGLTWSYLPTDELERIHELFLVSDNLIYCLGSRYRGLYSDPSYDYLVFKLINGDSLVTLSSSLINKYPHSIVVSSDKSLFVATSDGLYKATNDGVSWTMVYTYSSDFFVVGNMVMDNSDYLFLTASNSTKMLRSEDLGETWDDISQWKPNDLGLLYADTYNRLFYCTNSNGVYISETSGDSWDYVGPVSHAKVNGISISKYNQINIVVENETSLYSSTDRGKIWVDLLAGEASNLPFVSSYESTIISSRVLSTDNGKTWINFGNPNRSMLGSTVTSNYILFYVDTDFRAYQANIRISRSNDNGNKWEEVYSNAYSFRNFTTTNTGYVLAVVSYSDRLGYTTSYIIRSKDNGSTWDEKYFFSTIGALKPERLYAIGSVSDGTLFCSSNLALYRSTDDGDNWAKVDSIAAHSYFKDFTSDTLGNIYAYNSNGLFRSGNNGASWELIETNYSITSLASDYDGYLFIGTNSQGVFTNAPIGINPYNPNDSTISVPDSIPPLFSLKQNYPNPFNPSTTIEYSIQNKNVVLLELFDALGRRVKTLFNKEHEPGEYSFILDASNLSSGVYFYKLTAGSFIETKKLVFIK